MKKYLPTSRISGFTLIELMVVIAIIAILSLVALGIFNGAQGAARDARRIAEINALAKNIESTKDPSSLKYSYGKTLFAKDYPSGLTDPSSSNTYYCMQFSTTAITTKPTNSQWGAGGACPTGWTAVNSSATDASDLFYMVCAQAERGAGTANAICQGPFTK